VSSCHGRLEQENLALRGVLLLWHFFRGVTSRMLVKWRISVPWLPLRTVAVLTLSALVVALCGCGSSTASSEVSGKVTLKGDPVAGELVFVGNDKKEYLTPLNPDGKYSLLSVPKGEYAVVVRASSLPAAPTIKAPPPTGGGSLPEPPKAGVTPPAKYAKPGNGLTFTVTGGKQSKDFELAE